MRSLTFEELDNIIKENGLQINDNFVFIESGTYKGGTIFPISTKISKNYTIEINETAYKYCVDIAKKKNITNIDFFLGDTIDVLPKIIEKIENDKFCIFFLDGHVTENNSGFTGKGKVDVPLIEELSIIYNNYKGHGIIIIDDTRLLKMNVSSETAFANWSNISLETLLNSFKSDRIINHYFTVGGGKQKEKDDRIIIYF